MNEASYKILLTGKKSKVGKLAKVISVKSSFLDEAMQVTKDSLLLEGYMKSPIVTSLLELDFTNLCKGNKVSAEIFAKDTQGEDLVEHYFIDDKGRYLVREANAASDDNAYLHNTRGQRVQYGEFDPSPIVM